MNDHYQKEKAETVVHSDGIEIDPNAVLETPIMAMGGTGGSGGTGGEGGQAVNITYVDNYSMISLLYTLILLIVEDQNETKISSNSLSLVKTLMEQQREYRHELLEVLRSLKQ